MIIEAEGLTEIAPPPIATRRRMVAPLAIVGTGVAFTVAFFPSFFNNFQLVDDEGFFVMSVKEFLSRGSLYHHTSSFYGPFYFSILGALFRVLGADPSPFAARLVMLVGTGLALCVLAAVVYRVTRSLPAALLCEVTSAVVLYRANGSQPLHPASFTVVLVGVVLYCLASNLIRPRAVLLGVAGFCVGAVVLTKANVGGFLVVALVIWLLLGSAKTPRVVRVAVFVLATVLPFVLMGQTISQGWTARYALVVGVTALLVCVVARASAPLPTEFRTAPFMTGAAGAVVVSIVWPLAHGTSPGDLVQGVLIRPSTIASGGFIVPADIPVSWVWFAVPLVVGAVLAALWRDPALGGQPVREEQWRIALAFVGLLVLGLAVFGAFAAWMPIVALIPAIAHFVRREAVASSVLVLAVAVAVFQALQAYPVAGAQQAWSTVTVCVPCSIAVGLFLRESSYWRDLTLATRVSGVTVLCAFLVLMAGLWPYATWRGYLRSTRLGLPGTSLVRVDAQTAGTLQGLTQFVKTNCDTFYSVPPTNSLYVYTGIPSLTGLTTDLWGVLNRSEQLEIASALESAVRSGRRVCVVHEDFYFPQWQASSTGKGPLGTVVAEFNQPVTTIGGYSVWIRPGEAAPVSG